MFEIFYDVDLWTFVAAFIYVVQRPSQVYCSCQCCKTHVFGRLLHREGNMVCQAACVCGPLTASLSHKEPCSQLLPYCNKILAISYWMLTYHLLPAGRSQDIFCIPESLGIFRYLSSLSSDITDHTGSKKLQQWPTGLVYLKVTSDTGNAKYLEIFNKL